MSYEKAWKTLLKSIDGKIDGSSYAAEHGASSAPKELEVLQEVEEQVEEIAKENNIEKSIYDLDNKREAIMETKDGKPIYIIIGQSKYKDPGVLKPEIVDCLIKQLEGVREK